MIMKIKNTKGRGSERESGSLGTEDPLTTETSTIPLTGLPSRTRAVAEAEPEKEVSELTYRAGGLAGDGSKNRRSDGRTKSSPS